MASFLIRNEMKRAAAPQALQMTLLPSLLQLSLLAQPRSPGGQSTGPSQMVETLPRERYQPRAAAEPPHRCLFKIPMDTITELLNSAKYEVHLGVWLPSKLLALRFQLLCPVPLG